MPRFRFTVLGIIFATLHTLCFGQSAPISLEAEIPLANVEGRIDHLSVDADGKRLFVSALGNGSVEVVDIKLGQRIAEIKGLEEPQGVLYEPESKRLYVASGGDGTLRIYDGQTFAPLKTIDLGGDADNVRYDAQSKQVIVGYGGGGLAGFDSGLQKSYDIKLSSHPESFQLQQHGSLLFVNLPKSLGIAVVDRKENKVMHTWREMSALSNYPMALDESHHRLFIACRMPARLLILNAEDGKVVTKLSTVGDSDDLFFDEERQLLYVIGGEGALDIFHQKDADHYEPMARIKTAAGARTGLFVPALNRLFIAVPHRGSQAAKVLVYLAQSAK